MWKGVQCGFHTGDPELAVCLSLYYSCLRALIIVLYGLDSLKAVVSHAIFLCKKIEFSVLLKKIKFAG